MTRTVVLVDSGVGRHLPRLPHGLEVAKRRRRRGSVSDREKSDRR
eukprot:COSAG03_NODE_12595_length_540_cov_0.925170_1_plen_44_part_10